jgi:hypothetical protein
MPKTSKRPDRDPPKKRLPEEKPRVSFSRVVTGVVFLFTCGCFAFWFFCVQQPGDSFDRESLTDTLEKNIPAEVPTEQRLENYVIHLAETIGERNLGHYIKLCEAADYIEAELQSFGYRPQRQTYEVQGLDCFNIEAEIKGAVDPDDVVIIGAHYDSVAGSPGANDNASGTAAMLVLAKHFSKFKPERTLRFVAWTNEEPPYFQNRGLMGSWVYAEKCRLEEQDIVAVLSLETLGYYTDEADSQKYPPPLNFVYPSTGNFVGFVSNLPSRGLQRQVIEKFREHAEIPSEGASMPDVLPGIGWSDHWSFWQEGYAGLMVTDTAPYRYPYYHRITDTPDKLNYAEMAKAVDGLVFVVEDLSKQKP